VREREKRGDGDVVTNGVPRVEGTICLCMYILDDHLNYLMLILCLTASAFPSVHERTEGRGESTVVAVVAALTIDNQPHICNIPQRDIRNQVGRYTRRHTRNTKSPVSVCTSCLLLRTYIRNPTQPHPNLTNKKNLKL
jgi:hypothetical protein